MSPCSIRTSYSCIPQRLSASCGRATLVQKDVCFDTRHREIACNYKPRSKRESSQWRSHRDSVRKVSQWRHHRKEEESCARAALNAALFARDNKQHKQIECEHVTRSFERQWGAMFQTWRRRLKRKTRDIEVEKHRKMEGGKPRHIAYLHQVTPSLPIHHTNRQHFCPKK